MKLEVEKQILDDFLSFKIPQINSKIHFWMVRTQGGHFYNEFKKNSYIAFGWNIIDKGTDLKNERLIKIINDYYDKKRGGVAISKCDSFINKIQENDIILIPNKGLGEIIIALAGKYYEDDSKTMEAEQEVLWKIKHKEELLEEIECPYKKRRKITILRVVSGSEINPHLYKTLRNYSGIDDINEHAAYILSMLFDAFIFDNDLHISLKVRQSKDIALYDLSGILYGTSRYFSHFIKKENVTAKVNICSEGDIYIFLKDALELINTHGSTFVKCFLTLVGGTYGIIKLKEIPQFLKEIVTIKDAYKQEQISTEMKQEELRGEKLKNDLLEIEVEEKRRRVYENLNNQCINNLPSGFENELIAETSEPLQITPCELTEDARIAISAIVEQDEQAGTLEEMQAEAEIER